MFIILVIILSFNIRFATCSGLLICRVLNKKKFSTWEQRVGEVKFEPPTIFSRWNLKAGFQNQSSQIFSESEEKTQQYISSWFVIILVKQLFGILIMPATRYTCSSCKISRWYSDFPENTFANEFSACYFCSFEKCLNNIQNEIADLKNVVSGLRTDINEINDPKRSSTTEEKTILMNKIISISKETEKTEGALNSFKRKPQSERFAEENCIENPEDSENKFTEVNNGIKPKQKPEFMIPTSNPFSLLEVEELETNTILIGTSIVQNMDNEFVSRNPRKRKCKCVSKGSICDIENDLVDIQAEDDSLVCLMVGSNDVYKKESTVNDLIDKYRKAIQKIKENTSKVLCLGVLPRNFMSLEFSSRAIFFNTRLEEICRDENVSFANFWGSFANHNYLFRRDGAHLNDVGDARLGRLLDTEVTKTHREIIGKKQDFRVGQDLHSTLAK